VAFPTTGLLDAFNRANGALGANWTKGIYATTDSGLTITTNVVLSDGAGGRANAHGFWNPGTFGPDSEATLDVVSASGTVVGLWVRLSGTTGSMNGYAWKRDIGGATNEMSRYDAGAQTVLGVSTNGSGFAAGDSWGLEIVGNALKAYRKPSAGSWALESGRRVRTRLTRAPGTSVSRFGAAAHRSTTSAAAPLPARQARTRSSILSLSCRTEGSSYGKAVPARRPVSSTRRRCAALSGCRRRHV
jgi:hypothetical protein